MNRLIIENRITKTKKKSEKKENAINLSSFTKLHH